MKKKKLSIVGWLLVGIGIFWMVYLQFANPDMTGVRLLLTYWKQYLAIVVLVVSGMSVVFKDF